MLQILNFIQFIYNFFLYYLLANVPKYIIRTNITYKFFLYSNLQQFFFGVNSYVNLINALYGTIILIMLNPVYLNKLKLTATHPAPFESSKSL